MRFDIYVKQGRHWRLATPGKNSIIVQSKAFSAMRRIKRQEGAGAKVALIASNLPRNVDAALKFLLTIESKIK